MANEDGQWPMTNVRRVTLLPLLLIPPPPSPSIVPSSVADVPTRSSGCVYLAPRGRKGRQARFSPQLEWFWLPWRGTVQHPQCPGGVTAAVMSQSKLFIFYHVIFYSFQPHSRALEQNKHHTKTLSTNGVGAC
jgi:hypothetical protein